MNTNIIDKETKRKTVTFIVLTMASLLITAAVLTSTFNPMQAFAASGHHGGHHGGHSGGGGAPFQETVYDQLQDSSSVRYTNTATTTFR